MNWRYIKVASLAKCLYWRSGFFVEWSYYEEALLVKGRYLYKVTLLVLSYGGSSQKKNFVIYIPRICICYPCGVIDELALY